MASPQSAGLLTIQVNDVLDVGILPVNGLQVLQVSKNKLVVGGLAGGLVGRLRECILGGYRFYATVLSINGAQVLLRIEPL